MGKSRSEQFQQHVEALSEDDRRRALVTATGQLYLAAQGIVQQADRLRASESVTHTEHQNDAIFFVFALHRLVVLLRLALQLADDNDRAAVEAAIGKLQAVAGETQDARDVLSHLDEYAAGFGRKQPRAGLPPLPWFSRRGPKYTVRVGNYAIDVDAAEAAAVEAFSAVMELDD